jgi:hypothetical protein
MRRLFGAAAVAASLLALTLPANAVSVTLTNNPTSATGNFQLAPGAGAFEDQVIFGLTGGPQFVTIANATNTFANPNEDPILNWIASIWSAGLDGIVNNGDDVLLFGPQAASACIAVASCQFVGGSGTINSPGLYYAEFTGIGSGTSGYSGNISTFAISEVPIPAAAWLFGTGLVGLAALNRRRKKVAH